jgi:hypothetical protein
MTMGVFHRPILCRTGESLALIGLSRETCRRSGARNAQSQSPQRYFLVWLIRIMIRSIPAGFLILRCCERHFGHVFIYRPLIGMARRLSMLPTENSTGTQHREIAKRHS